ncbi:Flagellar hook protein FlgE [Roseibaca ekhonensis]|jgi:flagellar hook protein FlgE|uniref:Flagellar hook protein FlgE n=1 Tax=Roseinatronobacter ekhonensis TaxID=254356 RepID=A0A3B0MKJ1_9RHOB|nr:flagellar hook-basal body complex protein [Roseibaca ekhonensis]SUZ31597.1 Flagellar hook protein FlgE [Roseibaca ekhonensis]
MSITSSLNAGISGLRANATRLSTISDNIANSATYGYRRAQTSFHSMVIGSGLANQGAYSAGGVRSSTLRLADQGGALIGTQNATDIAVNGRGFLPVTSELGAQLQDGTAPMLLTTTGSFRQDANGYLRNPSGMVLLGWPAAENGTVPPNVRDNTSGLRPIQVAMNQQASFPTSRINMSVNLPASETLPTGAGDPSFLSVAYFDTLGLPGTLEVTFQPDGAANSWTMSIVDQTSGAAVGEYQLVFDDTSGSGGTLASVTPLGGASAYDPVSGSVDLTIGTQQINLQLGRLGEAGGLTQRGATFSPAGVAQDGFGAGNLIGLTIDASGNLDAVYDQGFRRTLYRVPLVDVPNPNGLTAANDQSFQISRDSGAFFLWDAGDGPVGEFVGFALQESATDVAEELTNLIQTQRAYSSNAKVIQTVDEMFQETNNIKR